MQRPSQEIQNRPESQYFGRFSMQLHSVSVELVTLWVNVSPRHSVLHTALRLIQMPAVEVAAARDILPDIRHPENHIVKIEMLKPELLEPGESTMAPSSP